MASCSVKEEMDCMDNQMSPIHPKSTIYKITYSKKMDKDEQRALKHQIIRNHPQTLIVDYDAKERMRDLVFYTEFIDKWYNVFCEHYECHTEKRGNATRILEVGNDQDPAYLTIHICNSGIVMLQGTQERLIDFGKIFFSLRDKTSSSSYAKNVSSDKHGKITSYFHIIKSRKRQSETDKLHGRQSHEDNTDNQKEEGDSKMDEENSLTQVELSGMQWQTDCADSQEGEKSNVKKEEHANKITDTI